MHKAALLKTKLNADYGTLIISRKKKSELFSFHLKRECLLERRKK